VFRVDDSYEDTMEEDAAKQEATIAAAVTPVTSQQKNVGDITKELFKAMAKETLEKKLQ
jgi:hypothetical protein